MIQRVDGASNGNGHAHGPPARDTISARRPTVLVTGGAGFIGTNLALELLDLGCRVRAYDDLSREGVARNAAVLEQRGGRRFQLVRGDVRDRAELERALEGADAVFHLAAQVAVTTSMTDPPADFDVNARGTLNVLDAIRASGAAIPLLYTSTNKVYGCVDAVPLVCDGRRYKPRDAAIERLGIGEHTIEFHTPYGCSKGAAEQYVLDYARTFGLSSTVFRMSCIYGPHQCGTEDQGWVAHFLKKMLDGSPITIYGDGCQVRDVLFVEDLVEAFLGFLARPEALAGRAFNVGGGPANAVSLLELLEIASAHVGRPPALRFEEWRASDQRWYVSDTRRIEAALSWRARVPVREGVARLCRWLGAQRPADVAAPVAER